ncbi:MAG: quinohemoprotein amine dehydrogenase maturation protein, partial [Acidobacteria bacterium]
MQNRFRVFSDGAGSYDVITPKIRELLRRHRSRPVGARVTLTSQTLDVERIFRHLTDEVGFWEVGFAPVTTAPGRRYAISDDGFDRMLEQFRALAREFLEYAAAGRHHGFSNVRDTLEEIHRGVSKAYPCGAGLGLMGVSTDGEVAPC